MIMQNWIVLNTSVLSFYLMCNSLIELHVYISCVINILGKYEQLPLSCIGRVIILSSIGSRWQWRLHTSVHFTARSHIQCIFTSNWVCRPYRNLRANQHYWYACCTFKCATSIRSIAIKSSIVQLAKRIHKKCIQVILISFCYFMVM